MSMENENMNRVNSSTTSTPVTQEFRTAGQAMQPPILSPSTVTRPPVYMQVRNVQPAQQAQPVQSTVAPKPVLAPQNTAAAQPVLAPQVSTQQTNPMQQQMPTYRPLLTPEAMASQPAPVTATAPAVQTKAAQTKAKKVKKEKSNAGSSKRIVAVAVAFCILGAGLATCGMVAYGMHWAEGVRSEAVAAAKKTAQKNSGSSGSNKSTTVNEGSRDYAVINTNSVDTSELHTAAEIYAANVNSTVGISTEINYNYYGYPTTGAAAGSGFILTSDGYIVTNYHVIQDANKVTVTLYDNSKYDAEIIGYDDNNDLAVLKIDAQNLTPVILGSSDNLNVGDDVVAIGNPLGELTFSLTKGCVSALNRTITIDNLPMNLIQTDCAINAGNSGGALFNMYGEVIGITNAKYSNNGQSEEATIESIGFAIPIDSVRNVIDSIIEKGYADKPYIGVYAETVYPDSGYDASEGIGISSVIEDTPAERAGLQDGDVIIKIDGVVVTDVAELKVNINRVGVGGQLTLTVLRDGNEIEIVVHVEADEAS